MKYLYLLVQLAFLGAITLIGVAVGRVVISEPTNIYSIELYQVGKLTKATWLKETPSMTWFKTNQELISKPKAYDFVRQIKLPILGNPENGFYRDPFVNADDSTDYFCNKFNQQEDSRLHEWLQQVAKDLQALTITGINEKESLVFLQTGSFTTWVSTTKPLSIPIPAEYQKTMMDKSPEQIKKGKLLLRLVKIDPDAVWFKVPLLRTPLKVVRTPMDNTIVKNILKPL